MDSREKGAREIARKEKRGVRACKPAGRERKVVGVPGRAQERSAVLKGTAPRLSPPAGNVCLAKAC